MRTKHGEAVKLTDGVRRALAALRTAGAAGVGTFKLKHYGRVDLRRWEKELGWIRWNGEAWVATDRMPTQE